MSDPSPALAGLVEEFKHADSKTHAMIVWFSPKLSVMPNVMCDTTTVNMIPDVWYKWNDAITSPSKYMATVILIKSI
jgi:hypothetical protein